jgi:hypothetical protein
MANGESKSLRKLTIPLSGGLDVTGRDRTRLVDGGPMLRDMRNVMISKGHIVPLPEMVDPRSIGIVKDLEPETANREPAIWHLGPYPGEIPVAIEHLYSPGQFERSYPVNPAPASGYNSDGFTGEVYTIVLTSKYAHTFYGEALGASPPDDVWNTARPIMLRAAGFGTVSLVNGSTTVTSTGTPFDSVPATANRIAPSEGWKIRIQDTAGPTWREYEVIHITSSTQLTIDRGYEGATEGVNWSKVVFYAAGGGGAYMDEYSFRDHVIGNALGQFPRSSSLGDRNQPLLWAGRAACGGQELGSHYNDQGGYNPGVCATELNNQPSSNTIIFSRNPHEMDATIHDYDDQLFDISGIEILPSAQVVVAGSARLARTTNVGAGLYSARIWHSDVAFPYYWNDAARTGGVIDLILYPGPLYAFKKFGNQYTVHFRNGIAVGYYTGDPYQPLEYRETFADIGALSPRTLLTIDGNQFFLGHDYRFHMFDGQRTRTINSSPVEALVPFPKNELRYAVSAIYDDINRQVWVTVSPYSKRRADQAAATGRGKTFFLLWDIETNTWSRPIDTDWIIGCLSSPFRDPQSQDWLMGIGLSTASMSGAPTQPASMYQVMRLVDSSWWKSPYRFVSENKQEFRRFEDSSQFTLSALDFKEVDVHIDVYFTRLYLPSDDDMDIELRLNINGDPENYVSDTKTLTEDQNTNVDEEKIVQFFFDAEGFEQATLTVLLEDDKTDFNISGAIEKLVIYYQTLTETQVVT